MSRGKELVRNTIILFIGKFCTQFVSFLLLPLYTSLLSTSEYGTIDLLQTYISLLIPIATLRIDAAAFRYLIDCRNKEEEKKKIITNIILLVVILNIIFIVCTALFNKFITIQYIELFILNVVVASISNVLLQMIRGLGDNIGYSIASSATAIFTIIFNVIFLVLFHLGVSSLLISSAIANIICILILIIKDKLLKYISKNKIDKECLKKLIKYSIPMVPTGLSWWILNVSDRTIISAIIGTAANGIYAIANKFPNIFMNIYIIFNLSWAESASLHIEDIDKDEFFTKTINTVFSLFVTICLGIIAALPIVFHWFINSQYDEAYLYIPILLIANIFNVIQGLCAGIYIAKKMSKKTATSTILAAIINIIVNILLINKIGIYACAFSTLIAYMVIAIYRYIDIQKYVKMRLYKKNVIFNIIMLVFTITMYYINYIYTNVLSIIIVLLYCTVINKDTIYVIINTIKNKIGLK